MNDFKESLRADMDSSENKESKSKKSITVLAVGGREKKESKLMQEFVKKLFEEEQARKDELDGIKVILPDMSTKYDAVERAKLKEFENKLLTNSTDKNDKPKIDIER